MSQFEEENDLGRGGGEVDDDTLREAWDTTEKRAEQPDEREESERAEADRP
jgi:hypothetical protein